MSQRVLPCGRTPWHAAIEPPCATANVAPHARDPAARVLRGRVPRRHMSWRGGHGMPAPVRPRACSQVRRRPCHCVVVDQRPIVCTRAVVCASLQHTEGRLHIEGGVPRHGTPARAATAVSIPGAKPPVCSLFDMPVNSVSAWTIFVNFYLSQTNQINLVSRLMPSPANTFEAFRNV